ncbi:hypothetical protein AST07_11880 [Staphylococcus saprophyticus]|jgi:cellulose synthase/poly-beta-1,6-N-acetylglucosamine synthase-like glycosyltransferase|uniref:Permease n=2 Tax=Staphylococcus TaxID=1279 RepID=Q49ZH0_STAS1|nr:MULTISPECIES: hypothetical protein [Staphylococcus]CRV28633.1 Uncharacterised protein [Streptococcus equi subsp. equi]SIN58298.1 Uncharacterised protein [Mycobacteroides abscessus subsp. abscessus]AMG19732.1 hypothetical protein AL528_05705 [Staphylococcus saprophyticus]AMG32836.1 hypothetical protein AL494_03270 [Staphylococcus saprophyticus]ASE58770.1 hypothetical protein CEQ14_06135 [Staphylococcus saprophyticus]
MKRGIRMTLLVLSVLLIVSELVYGIPFLGGSIVLSFGWQPLLINALLYFIMMIILIVDKQNSIKPMMFIPLLGVIGSFLAFIPLVGMVIHWILFFLMLFFIFILLSTPLYVPNKYAKVIYTEDRRKNH